MKKLALLTLASLLLVGFGCTIDSSVTEHQDEPDEQVEEIIKEEITAPMIDSDDDGITDYDEIELYQTDPNDTDSDDDGYSDYDEVTAGYDPNEPATTTTTIVEEDVTFDEPGLTLHVDEVITTIDCGSDPSCFDEKFTACEPSTMMSDVGGWVAGSYEITEPSGNGCAVTMMYTTNPNPEWENLPLYCVLDNTKDFETASQEAWLGAFSTEGYCTGPFNDMFHSEDRPPAYESGSGEVIQVN